MMFTLDELIDQFTPQMDGETTYRIAVPCILMLSATTPNELREQLFDVFGDDEFKDINPARATVLYPGCCDERIFIEDTEG